MALVLVVDDETLVRMNAVDMAEELGHDAIEASSADEAIRILENCTDIEIVFSDVQMPGTMDGVRLLRVIRDRWPPVKLILTSGKALAEGAVLPRGSVFISKPYSMGNLTDAFAKAAVHRSNPQIE